MSQLVYGHCNDFGNKDAILPASHHSDYGLDLGV
jgi:hypothetical protein